MVKRLINAILTIAIVIMAIRLIELETNDIITQIAGDIFGVLAIALTAIKTALTTTSE